MVKVIYKQTKRIKMQEKEKKQRRNYSERKRRYKLKVGFYILSKKIPTYLKTNVGKRMNQCQTLNYAIQYIKDLYLFLEISNKEKETE